MTVSSVRYDQSKRKTLSKTKCEKKIIYRRYGREDEEVMGLKFCNEAIIALQQIWPKAETEERFSLSPLQVN